MPRPDSGPLAGVLAGIEQFKATRQFYQQMESTDLQQEASRAQIDMYGQRMADYESPADVDARRRQGRLEDEASLAAQRSDRNLAAAEPSGRKGYIWRRNPNTQAWEEVKDDAYWIDDAARRKAAAGQDSGSPGAAMKAEKALAMIDEFAQAQGMEIPGGAVGVSSNALDMAVQYMMANRSGTALTIVRADKFSKMPELDWLSELPDDAASIASQKLYELAGQAPTIDNVLAEMNKLRMQFENQGVLPARINIDEMIRGKYPVADPMSPQRLLLPKRELSEA